MLDAIKEIGFYLYKQKLYTNKVTLYSDILLNKDKNPDVSFWFSDDIFGKIDWTIEPEWSLQQLYEMRARQIRESYDYVLLGVSGGADSTNMLKAFLSANLHIDEVVTTYPIRFINSLPPLENPETHPLGILYEYEFAALPLLKEVERRSPKTKISILDASDWIESKYKNEKFISDKLDFFLTRQIFQLMLVAFQTEYIDKIFSDMGKQKICGVWGNDKPLFFMRDSKLYFHFFDEARGLPGTYDFKATNYDALMFYWSRNFPLIPIKQAHVFLKEIQKNETARQMLEKSPFTLKETEYMKKLIYPESFDPRLFQKKIKNQDDETLNFFFGKYGTSDGNEAKSYVTSKYDAINDAIRPLNYAKNNVVKPRQRKTLMFLSKPYYIGDIN